jgi:hypothetical protein
MKCSFHTVHLCYLFYIFVNSALFTRFMVKLDLRFNNKDTFLLQGSWRKCSCLYENVILAFVSLEVSETNAGHHS